jgi:hypothetical protein
MLSCRDDKLGKSEVHGIGSERGGYVAVRLVTSHALAYTRSEDRPRAAVIPFFFLDVEDTTITNRQPCGEPVTPG